MNRNITWEIQKHTKVKHMILKEYLKAWFPILGHTHDEIIYLDGFAGPGKYKKGEPGSPVIAIQTAIEHPSIHKFGTIRFIFIEEEKIYGECLKKELKQKFRNLQPNIVYEVEIGNFSEVLPKKLDEIKKRIKQVTPILAFIDPFGYSDTPADSIDKLLENDKCEILLTFMTQFINRFVEMKQYESIFNKLFGKNAWEEVKAIKEDENRLNLLTDIYVRQLKEKGFIYVRPFKMIDNSRKRLYDLIFVTKNKKGLEKMKESMLKVAQNEEYSFSDEMDDGQTYILDYMGEQLDKKAEIIFNKFSGKIALYEEIKHFVLIDTPFLLKRDILKHMEKNGQICQGDGRKRGVFPDGCQIRFKGDTETSLSQYT